MLANLKLAPPKGVPLLSTATLNDVTVAAKLSENVNLLFKASYKTSTPVLIVPDNLSKSSLYVSSKSEEKILRNEGSLIGYLPF